MANISTVFRVVIFAMLYCTFGKIALGTTIQIDPSVLSVAQSQAFSLDVAITDAIAAPIASGRSDLAGWDFHPM